MPDSGSPDPGRRAVLGTLLGLGAAGGLALAGCGNGFGQADSDETTAQTGTGDGSPTGATPSEPTHPSTTSPVVLPKVDPWTPLPGEIEPACKVAAVQAATASLTVTSEGRTAVPDALAPLARMVSGVERSVVQVVYPQYGGLTDNRRLASVMLVADLVSVTPGATEASTVSITTDIRLRGTGGPPGTAEQWTVTEVKVPAVRERPTTVPAAVTALLENERVELPREAELDLVSGEIDPRVVTLLGDLSQEWRLGVCVLKAAHPWDVFATGRISNHSLGRAADVWSLDGIPVIAQDEAPWRPFMREASRLGSNSIGGPTRIGGSPPYFSDDVHQDHIHIAFNDKDRERVSAP